MQDFKRFIQTQRDGLELNDSDIKDFVDAVGKGDVSDAQVGAYVMAVYLCGMTGGEMVTFTKAMRDSGEVLDWSDLDGPVVDKHSTGGVGDLTSLILAPIIATAGGYVPMISGRALGHTGGTLDKLDTIPGYNSAPDTAMFRSVVKDIGCAIIGQTEELAPADRKLYAIRDHVGAVESIPLIVGSIISKKLAAGVNTLVLDVKAGSGAFMSSFAKAKKLATKLVGVAQACDMKVSAIISDMSQPLASSAGNALEVREAIGFLKNTHRNPRLYEVVEKLAEEMLIQTKLSSDVMKADNDLSFALDSGTAAERFGKMVAALGGPTDLVENPDKYLPAAKVVKPVYSEKTGMVHAIDTRVYGQVVSQLGGMHSSPSNDPSPAVGLSNIVKIGGTVNLDVPIATIHANSEDEWETAAQRLRAATAVEVSHVNPTQTILDVMKPTRFG